MFSRIGDFTWKVSDLWRTKWETLTGDGGVGLKGVILKKNLT